MMRAMTRKQKIIAIVVGLLLAALAAVQWDMWHTARQAEQANPPQIEETRP